MKRHYSLTHLCYSLMIGVAFALRSLRQLTKLDLFRLNSLSADSFGGSALYTAWRIATGKRTDCVRRLGGPIPTDTPRVLVSISNLAELNGLKPLINSLINSGYTVVFLVHCPTTVHLITEEIPDAEIFELPIDLKRNAATILDAVTPSCVLVGDFIYGSPLNFLSALQSRGIPAILLNAVIPAEQPRWLPQFNRAYFDSFSRIYAPTEGVREAHTALGVAPERVEVRAPTRWIAVEPNSRDQRTKDELVKLFKLAPSRRVITVTNATAEDASLLVALIEGARKADAPPLVLVSPMKPGAWGAINAELLKHTITTAHRTGLACRQYGSIKPELIFLDMLGELRAALSFTSVCLVARTAASSEYNLVDALRCGIPVVLAGGGSNVADGIHDVALGKRVVTAADSLDDTIASAFRLLDSETERDRLAGLSYLMLRQHHDDLQQLLALLPIPSIFAATYAASELPTKQPEALDPMKAVELGEQL